MSRRAATAGESQAGRSPQCPPSGRRGHWFDDCGNGHHGNRTSIREINQPDAADASAAAGMILCLPALRNGAGVGEPYAMTGVLPIWRCCTPSSLEDPGGDEPYPRVRGACRTPRGGCAERRRHRRSGAAGPCATSNSDAVVLRVQRRGAAQGLRSPRAAPTAHRSDQQPDQAKSNGSGSDSGSSPTTASAVRSTPAGRTATASRNVTPAEIR